MKSDICYLYKHKGRDVVLAEVEKTAAYCELTHKEQLQLRLLAEELVGIAEGVTGECRGLFFVEAGNDKDFALHLQMEKPKASEGREKLIGISKRNRNEAATGLMGRIRAFFEESMDNYEETGVYCAQNGIRISQLEDMYAACVTSGEAMTWTLRDYEKQEPEEKDGRWDELERSIVANLADDVLVSMKGRHAEIIVKKKF